MARAALRKADPIAPAPTARLFADADGGQAYQLGRGGRLRRRGRHPRGGAAAGTARQALSAGPLALRRREARRSGAGRDAGSPQRRRLADRLSQECLRGRGRLRHAARARWAPALRALQPAEPRAAFPERRFSLPGACRGQHRPPVRGRAPGRLHHGRCQPRQHPGAQRRHRRRGRLRLLSGRRRGALSLSGRHRAVSGRRSSLARTCGPCDARPTMLRSAWPFSLFHLLFMGRHPFAGRFLGAGEMPIEKAIAECRFAYSRDARRTKMAPPPFTPPLAVAGPATTELFERAFHPMVASGGRPTAEDWVKASGCAEGFAGRLRLGAVAPVCVEHPRMSVVRHRAGKQGEAVRRGRSDRARGARRCPDAVGEIFADRRSGTAAAAAARGRLGAAAGTVRRQR